MVPGLLLFAGFACAGLSVLGPLELEVNTPKLRGTITTIAAISTRTTFVKLGFNAAIN